MVPGYEVLELLGRGGMGVVYKARQIALDRVVALKMILHAEHAGSSDRERFRIEAEAVARLQHPNIVAVYEVGEHNGMPFFSQEFCDGGSLDRRLRGTPLSPREAASLVETLARAVHHAHQKGVVHRDLKPANILLVSGGVVSGEWSDPSGTTTHHSPLTPHHPKIGDFGLAKKLDTLAVGPTRSGAILGSPPYMSPEQARGDSPAIGPATDVYSLGAILYELLTGRPPFLDASVQLTLLRVLNDDPVPVRRLQPKVPHDLETICHHCLEKNPQKRYRSALALAEDLRRFQAWEPVAARRAGALERTAKWTRRRPTAAALTGVALLGLLGLLVAIPFNMSHLRAVAAQARADAHRERTLREWESARADGVKWLADGQAVLARRGAGAADLEEARRLFTNARDRISDPQAQENAELRRLRADAVRLLSSLQQRLKEWEAYQGVFRQRDRALFLLYGDAFTCTEPEARAQWRDRAAEAAREALQRHGWPDDLPGAAAPASLTEADKEALQRCLYELCLVLAEAVAPRPDQPAEEKRRLAGEALRVLHWAETLVPGGRALHLRRARYLARCGEVEAAAGEQALAEAAGRRTSLDWFFEGCDCAFDEGKFTGALHCFNEGLRLQPDLFWAHFFRAVVCQKLHNAAEARSSLTVCAVLQPDFPWTYLVRGSLAGQQGDFTAAADDFARADKLLPADDRSARYVLLVNRGFVALRRQDLAGAKSDLEEALRLRPDLYAAHVNLAEVCAQQHDYVRAVRHLDQAIVVAKDLVAGSGRRMDSATRLATLYSTRARMHLERKEQISALADLDQAIGVAAPAAVPRSLARDHRERALVLSHLGRYPQALLACEAALAIRPDDPATHRLHGEVLLEVGCYEQALAAFDRSEGIDRNKTDAELFRQRARARLGLQDAHGAVEEYTLALRRVADADTYAARGWVYLDAEAPRLALADFEEALRRDPQQGDFYTGRGLARIRLGDLDGPADAEEALRHGSGSWRLSYNAARVFARAAFLVDTQRPAGSARLLERYRGRTITCLRDALEQCPEKERPLRVVQVLRDPAFHFIRHSPAFTRLMREYASPP
jgi:tetratricopeptide (TPR) repeat protein